ncbi:3-dehydroquinate synthase [Limosilactobacillus caccae]|uniref:3-dehydroquinate synthase n=1 Tax=Limosilactobacillus caccae TaxID=1926284 RepID=UPI00097113A5|nr:3-dehydroquinate synthase [Limosilactobacillus caccae]
MKKITVNLTNKNYDVVIEHGLLKQVGNLVAQQWSPRKVAVISDDNVAPLYQEEVAHQLNNAGFDPHCYQFPAGENSKSLTTLAQLTTQLVNDHFNREDGVIALGGGVTGDLAGFLAASYMRGIALIQIPTSLLAQVDSSVGGKTAVNLNHVKNIVGAFYEPDLVMIDPLTLDTLKQRDLVEGYGEVVKTAALAGGDLWQLIQHINSVSDLLDNAAELSALSIQYKAAVVMADEKEGGKRQFLNFGHTIGHAIEALSAGSLRHGEAVSIGMIALCKGLAKQKIMLPRIGEQIANRLTAVGLPTTSPLLSANGVMAKIKNDKKNRHGHLNIVYLADIGHPAIKTMTTDQVAATFNLQ